MKNSVANNANNANLRKLMEGNKRYVSSNLNNTDISSERRFELKHGQYPFAIILGCSDSRVPVEILFDQGLGDLYVVRVAGNVIGRMIVASIEYAVLHLNVSLIMVMGHSQCGAVKATCDNEKLEGSLPSLTSALSPALNSAKDMPGDLVENVAIANIRNVVKELGQSGANFPGMIESGKLDIVPAYYNIDTGKVDLL